jgi:Family of unknown function (DUF5995)
MDKVPAPVAQTSGKSIEGNGQMPSFQPPTFGLQTGGGAKSAGLGPLKMASKGKATVIAPQAAVFKKVGDARTKTNPVGHFAENAEIDLLEDGGLGKGTHYFVYGEFNYVGGGTGKEYVFIDASDVKLADAPAPKASPPPAKPQPKKDQPAEKAATTDAPAAAPDQTWRGIGNLRGYPPVRSESPHNINVVEDETNYNMLLDIARASLKSITAEADKMNPTGKNVSDHKFWFAKVYQFVTEGEIDFVENKTFYYPSYVLLSVIYFEKIYRDNLTKGTAGAEAHWKEAFERADGDNDDWVSFFYEAVYNLVDSMIAHIRFDLPRAEAWIYNSHYKSMKGVQFSDFKPDFMSMGPIFDKAGVRMNDVINKNNSIFRAAIASWMPSMLQDWGMTYMLEADMAAERADTWKRAEMLVDGGLNTDDPFTIKGGAISGDATTGSHRKGIDQLSNGMAPTMNEEADEMSDDEVRERVDGLTDAEISALPTSERMRMLFGLMAYYTGNDDEAAIYRILENSTKDFVDLVNAAGAWRIALVTDFSDYDKLRNLFVQRYYAHVAPTTAGGIIKKCADGETANWEETMILDILQAWEGSTKLPLIVEMTGADHLLDNVDGDNYTEARRILRAAYYTKMSELAAFSAILSALEETSTEEYQEEMIIDILEAHPQRRSIVVRIGQEKLGASHSESAQFDKGIALLKDTLDGDEQSRLETLFGV